MTDTEKIETAARRIHYDCCIKYGLAGDMSVIGKPWDELPENLKDEYRWRAKAVLRASA
jgi:hypothetical protein